MHQSHTGHFNHQFAALATLDLHCYHLLCLAELVRFSSVIPHHGVFVLRQVRRIVW